MTFDLRSSQPVPPPEFLCPKALWEELGTGLRVAGATGAAASSFFYFSRRTAFLHATTVGLGVSIGLFTLRQCLGPQQSDREGLPRKIGLGLADLGLGLWPLLLSQRVAISLFARSHLFLPLAAVVAGVAEGIHHFFGKRQTFEDLVGRIFVVGLVALGAGPLISMLFNGFFVFPRVGAVRSQAYWMTLFEFLKEARIPKGSHLNVLDVGCGNAIEAAPTIHFLERIFQARSVHYVGFDFAEGRFRQAPFFGKGARRVFPISQGSRVTLVSERVENIVAHPELPKNYDLVLINHPDLSSAGRDLESVYDTLGVGLTHTRPGSHCLITIYRGAAVERPPPFEWDELRRIMHEYVARPGPKIPFRIVTEAKNPHAITLASNGTYSYAMLLEKL